MLSTVFGPTTDGDDRKSLEDDAETVLASIERGTYPKQLGNPDTAVFILGLLPYGGRLSIRFWWNTKLRTLVDNLHRHYSDIQIVRSSKVKWRPTICQLLRETEREWKDTSPVLAAALMRSVFMAAPYPEMLLTSAMRRIRADANVRYAQAAAIRAYLNRNIRLGVNLLPAPIGVSLDKNFSDAMYQMGRYFAELEKTEEDAIPGIAATAKDRYFARALTSPFEAFRQLERLSQHHLSRLEPRWRSYHKGRLLSIRDQIRTFPNQLNIRSQGVFALGYYHQRESFFAQSQSTVESWGVGRAA